MQKGFFLVLEGCEGSGKTTVGQWLLEQLAASGEKVFSTREPGGKGSLVAEKIRTIILDTQNNVLPITEAYLFAAARAQHVEEVIKPHLAKNEIVICDRFVYSSYAYQGGGRQLGLETIKRLNALAVGDLKPDLVLLFDLDPALGLERKRSHRQDFDRLDQEDLLFHQRVRNAYLELAQENSTLFKIIDAQKPLIEVESRALNYLKDKLKEVNYVPN